MAGFGLVIVTGTTGTGHLTPFLFRAPKAAGFSRIKWKRGIKKKKEFNKYKKSK